MATDGFMLTSGLQCEPAVIRALKVSLCHCLCRRCGIDFSFMMKLSTCHYFYSCGIQLCSSGRSCHLKVAIGIGNQNQSKPLCFARYQRPDFRAIVLPCEFLAIVLRCD